MPVRTKTGDILECTEPILVHQCNCVTIGSRGLASSVFKKFPKANTYLNRTNPLYKDVPGTCQFIEIEECKKTVVNLYGQYNPGYPSPTGKDCYKDRTNWFESALKLLAAFMKERKFTSVAFPLYIGCGLAGGQWSDYYTMIEKNLDEFEVIIYQQETSQEPPQRKLTSFFSYSSSKNDSK